MGANTDTGKKTLNERKDCLHIIYRSSKETTLCPDSPPMSGFAPFHGM